MNHKVLLVGSKANKPDASVLRKKSSNKDVTLQSPSVNIQGPSAKIGGQDVANALGSLAAGLKGEVKADLGKGKISIGGKAELKTDKNKDKKMEEPKEKPIQMKSFISQDVHAPIHPARVIPKIKIFKGFPSKKKKK